VVATFAANVTFLFREQPYLERFGAARDAGFSSVETAWPTDDVASVVRAIRSAGLEVALINMPAGNLSSGERGFTNDPTADDRWAEAFESTLDVAGRVGCPVVNILAGKALATVPYDVQLECIRSRVAWAADRAREVGRRVVVELLNSVDCPGYLLSRLDQTLALIRSINDPALGLQFDTYHVAIMEHDILAAGQAALPWIGHVQISDMPGRHEPGTGTLPLGALLDLLRSSGYAGNVGLEYVPTTTTIEGLSWLHDRQTTWPVL
jgi:hydroxypyruvate isomerase